MNRMESVRRQYQSNAGSHTMTVLHEDGLYRHLRFSGPNSFYWFDIITWPKGLTINGGMGTFTLKVDEDDVLGLFLRSASPSYWQEKVYGTDHAQGHYGWLSDVFEEEVRAAVDIWAADLDDDDAVLLRDRVDMDVLAYSYSEGGATQAISSFRFDGRGFTGWSEWECEGLTDRFIFNCIAVRDAAGQYHSWKAGQ